MLRFDEAAATHFGGDAETLRQSLLMGLIRAKAEVVSTGTWAWWRDADDADVLPETGKSAACRWRHLHGGSYELAGWFYISHRAATLIAHGKATQEILVSVSEEDEEFLGKMFLVRQTPRLEDLWFEPSPNRGHIPQPEDREIAHMAETVRELTSDSGRVARFEAAAQVGAGALSFQTLDSLRREFGGLTQLKLAEAIVTAERERYREERAKGGYARKRSTDAAKKLAQELGPQAIREGWTASALMRVLSGKGEEIGHSTAASWLRQLRAGKNLIG